MAIVLATVVGCRTGGSSHVDHRDNAGGGRRGGGHPIA